LTQASRRGKMPVMPSFQPAKLLRLHFTERDSYRGQALYKAIVEKCREMKIAGVTVFRGIEGFGETAEIHRAGSLSHNSPIVVHVVDTAENIDRLLPLFEEMMDGGLIAISNVNVLRIQAGVR